VGHSGAPPRVRQRQGGRPSGPSPSTAPRCGPHRRQNASWSIACSHDLPPQGMQNRGNRDAPERTLHGVHQPKCWTLARPRPVAPGNCRAMSPEVAQIARNIWEAWLVHPEACGEKARASGTCRPRARVAPAPATSCHAPARDERAAP
jgi:hypothetical protein